MAAFPILDMAASPAPTLAIGPSSGVDQLRLFKIDHPQSLVPWLGAAGLDAAASRLRTSWTAATVWIRPMKTVTLLAAILLEFATAASAQTTYRDASGRITGTVSTDSNGQRTFRDGSGRMTGTANTIRTAQRHCVMRRAAQLARPQRQDAELGGSRSRVVSDHSRPFGPYRLAASDPARGGHPALPHWLQTRAERLNKVQSVDQRMRLECGVGFRQLRTCRRIRPGQLCAMCGRLRVGKSFLHVCSIGRCSHVFGL